MWIPEDLLLGWPTTPVCPALRCFPGQETAVQKLRKFQANWDKVVTQLVYPEQRHSLHPFSKDKYPWTPCFSCCWGGKKWLLCMHKQRRPYSLAGRGRMDLKQNCWVHILIPLRCVKFYLGMFYLWKSLSSLFFGHTENSQEWRISKLNSSVLFG